MKQPKIIEQETNQYEAKDVSKWLWIVLALILSGGYVLGEYEEAEEIKIIPHIWEGKGYLIDNKPVLIDENCSLWNKHK